MERTQAEEYLRLKVHPILEKLVVQLLVNRPDDPLLYMSKWITNAINSKKPEMSTFKSQQKSVGKAEEKGNPASKQVTTKKSISSDSSQSIEDLVPVPAPKPRTGPRTSVSAQAFGQFHKKKEFKPVVLPKTTVQSQRISKIMMKSFMFNSLDPAEVKIVIDAMIQRTYKPKDWVIKQYEDGNQLYIVESGELDCSKEFKKGAEKTFLKTYKPGESFGELSLLYNVPRQASIQAKVDCVLWSLDRETFSNIVQSSVVSKRERYDDFLKNVKLFKGMDPYELTKLGQTLKLVKLQAGQYVCKQNDQGKQMYLVEQGTLSAIKNINGTPTEVLVYYPGDYFGEIALMKKVPRQASIKTQTKCSLLCISKEIFDRMIGVNNSTIIHNLGRYTGLKLDN